MNLELTADDKKILNAALWLFWTYAHDRHNEIAQDRDNRLTFKDMTPEQAMQACIRDADRAGELRLMIIAKEPK